METVSLMLSIVALIVSIVVAIIEYKRDYKINTINIEFEFYRDIYKEHLVKKIPNTRKLMWIDQDSHLRDAEALIDELNSIRQDSLYFLYNDKKFYDKLKEQLQALEDYLVNAQGTRFIGEEQTEFYNKVQEGLNKIYCTISDSYLRK